jgi:hypothetical protein
MIYTFKETKMNQQTKISVANGVVLYSGKNMIGGKDVVVVATFHSKNRKTGKMVQVWILTEDIHPVEAYKSGQDDNCGVCPIRNVCYVNIGQAPTAVWKAYKRGTYPTYDYEKHGSWFRGRKVRWGAYGDPACIPLGIVRGINRIAKDWTGYTHQVSVSPRRGKLLAKYFMISVETKEQAKEEMDQGRRVFQVIKGDTVPEGMLMCPNYTHDIQCIDCCLCKGQASGGKSICIPSHGAKGNNLAVL